MLFTSRTFLLWTEANPNNGKKKKKNNNNKQTNKQKTKKQKKLAAEDVHYIFFGACLQYR